MKTYSQALAQLYQMAKIDSADTATGSVLMGYYNDSIRTICNIRNGKWPFLLRSMTIPVSANTSSIVLPPGIRKIVSMYVLSSNGIKYPVTPIYNQGDWDMLTSANVSASSTNNYAFMSGRTLNLYPAIASTAGSLVINYRPTILDLPPEVDATNVLVLINNGSTTLNAQSPFFSQSMIGKWVRIQNYGAGNYGDGQWYQIVGFVSTSQVTLGQPYAGASVNATPATIGWLTIIPDAYDMAPIYRSLALFAQVNDPLHQSVADSWWRLYDGGQEKGLSRDVGGILGQMLENEGASMEASYMNPNAIGDYDPNDPPQGASGF